MRQRRSLHRTAPAGLLACLALACDATEPPAGSIAGSVHVESEPVGGALVSLTGDTTASAITGTDGSFHFPATVGSYHLAIDRTPLDAEFVERSRAVRIETPGQATLVDFPGTWIRTSSIAGVLAADAEPIVGARVAADGLSRADTRSGKDGSFLLSGLRAGAYEITVSDYDQERYGFSDVRLSATAGVGQRVEATFEIELRPPLAPVALSATHDGPFAMHLTWQDVSAHEHEYRLVRRQIGGEWGPPVSLEADRTSFHDQGLDPGITYAYRLTACNDVGCSDPSDEASDRTEQIPPTMPGGFAAEPIGPVTVVLSWEDLSPNEAGFHVDRSSDGGATWMEVTVTGPDEESHTDTGLVPATEYRYRVSACNAAGCSSPSPTASATTGLVPQDNLVISGVHITQVVQTLSGSVPLVSSTGGLLRVFVTTGLANTFQPDVRVNFYHDGSLVQTALLPAPAASVPLSVDEGSLTASWNVPVSAGLVGPGLAVLVEVDPSNTVPEVDETDNVYPASGTPAALDVRTPGPFPVVFVPVKQSVNGLEGEVGDPDGFFAVTNKLFPVGMSASTRSTYVTDAPELQSGNGNNAWGTILSEISALRAVDGSTDAYFGVVRVGYGGGVAGIGYIGAPVALGWDKRSRAGVAAHEWGHNLGRRHAPCGGPGGVDTNYPYAGGVIGAWGYDRSAGVLKAPDSYRDFMGYCSPDWISDYTFTEILDFWGGASTASRAEQRRPSASRRGTSLGPPAPGLLVWGRIDAGGAVLEPAFDVTAPARLPKEPGPYRVRGLDGNGAVLFELAFAGDELPEEVGGGRHFAFVVPTATLDREALTSLLLEGPEDRAALSPPGRAGGAREADPVAAVTAGGLIDLRWDASRHPMALVRDADTGAVTSFARGGSVRLPGSPAALVVQLSDGVRSTSRQLVPR